MAARSSLWHFIKRAYKRKFTSYIKRLLIVLILSGYIGISLYFTGLHDSTFFWVIELLLNIVLLPQMAAIFPLVLMDVRHFLFTA